VAVTVQKSLSAPFMILDSTPQRHAQRGISGQLRLYQFERRAQPRSGHLPSDGFRAGQYAMRIWVQPDQLAKLNITVPELSAQSTVRTPSIRPAKSADVRSRPDRNSHTPSARKPPHLRRGIGDIVLRATPDGAVVRLKDVARIELSAADYDVSAISMANRPPSWPCSNFPIQCHRAAKGVKKLWRN